MKSIYDKKNKLCKLGIVFMIICMLYANPITAFASPLDEIDHEKIEQYQQALIDTAYQYYYRGNSISFDEGAMTYNTKLTEKRVRKSECTFSPEEATQQYVKYVACSPFLWLVYYETFVSPTKGRYQIGYYENDKYIPTSNSNHFIYMTNPKREKYYQESRNISILNISSGDVNKSLSDIDLVEKGLCESTENCSSVEDEIMKKIKSVIQPGDIIGYLYLGASNSHVVMYNGSSPENNFKVVNAWVGSSYNYTSKKDNVSKYSTVDTWNEAAFREKAFKKVSDSSSPDNGKIRISEIAILRPLNEVLTSDYEIADNVKKRQVHKNLVRTKIASKEKYDSVNAGEEITYTIILDNKSTSKDYENIVITDQVPNNTELVKIDEIGNNNNGKLSWTISVPKGQKKEVYYTVKVKQNIKAGEKITNDKTIADGIKLNTIETTVNNTLTPEQQQQIITTVSDLEGKKLNTTEELLNKIYPTFNFVDYNSDTLLKTFYTTNNSLVEGKTVYILKDNIGTSKIEKMYVDGLYGGYYAENPDYNNELLSLSCSATDGRNKTFRNNTFTVGDILVLRDSDYQSDSYVAGETNSYIYLGDGKFATVKDSKVIILDQTVENTTRSRLIDSLLGQDAFIVLRPSYAMHKGDNDSSYITDDEGEEIVKNVPNTKMSQAIASMISSLIGIILVVSGFYVASNQKKEEKEQK